MLVPDMVITAICLYENCVINLLLFLAIAALCHILQFQLEICQSVCSADTEHRVSGLLLSR